MLLERYEYKNDTTFRRYTFFSNGPKGLIKKRVTYRFLGVFDGKPHYNLGFGDYSEEDNTISDLSVSNNQDRDKILATVAFTAIEFSNLMQGCRIVIEGSTPSRTRLYQMAIAKYYDEIYPIFEILGLSELNDWVDFTKGENYFAFLATRK